jgi:apolipoprotein N-acyltransferase
MRKNQQAAQSEEIREARNSFPYLELLACVLTALTLAGAWLMPGSYGSAALGFCAAIGFAAIPWFKRPYWSALLIGIIVHPIAFHWLRGTIQEFGGFPPLAASGIFAFFVLGSSLQFLIYVALARRIVFALRAPLACGLAWAVSEVLSPRIFPWFLGHAQLAFQAFSHQASYAGALWVSTSMMFLAVIAKELIVGKTQSLRRASFLIPLLLSLTGFLFSISDQYFPQRQKLSRSMLVRVVQGNVSLYDKHNPRKFLQNLNEYIDASLYSAADVPDLMVWPETVVMEFLDEDIQHVEEHPALAHIYQYMHAYFTRLPNTKMPALLLGSLAKDKQGKIYNSAFLILGDGKVLRPYHKIILMPFGEFTPFGDIFPWLRELNSTVGDFGRGTGPIVMGRDAELPLTISPLVCYEDVREDLALNAVRAGAQVLVNVTNDAWFGNTVASRQHHLIASFRAIETGVPLVRSSNTGFSAVVDYNGKTLSYSEPFTKSAFDQRVFSKPGSTAYLQGLGNLYSLAVLLCVASILVFRLLKSLIPKR